MRKEHIPARRSDQIGVQHGILGDYVQPGPLVYTEIHPGLVGDEQDQQHGVLVADGGGQALAGAGVLLQGSLTGTPLVILSNVS